jgi:hypothetical protein
MEAIKSQQTEPFYTPERPRGITFDENGNAIGYMDRKEAIDMIDKELIEELGEEYREFANDFRTWWNTTHDTYKYDVCTL